MIALNTCRFAGSILVRTVGDDRSQEDYLRFKLLCDANQEVPLYLAQQQTPLDMLKTVTMREIRTIAERLKSLKLIPGHNLKTAQLNYGEDPETRGKLHQALSALGAEYIDSDGELLQDSFKFQLRDQYLKQFGLPLEREILKLLKQKKLTLAVAESATGGLVSSRLTDIPGCSYAVNHNFVTYCNEAKIQSLGVDADYVNTQGPYNPKTAIEMAEGVQRVTGAKVGLSFTGLAGCNKWDDSFAGKVYIGLSGLTPKPIVKLVSVDAALPRPMKKQLFSEYGLIYLKQYLEGRLKPEQ
jgi:PncC family amidohydrolase